MQFDRLVEVIGYGGTIGAFAILTLSAAAGLVNRDFGQRVDTMLAALAPISFITEQLAAKHAQRVRVLEELGLRLGAPLRPGEADPDPTVVEASLTYPDSFVTRWAFDR